MSAKMSGDTGHLLLDTRGTFCPVPIIRTSEALRNLESGSLVEVVSDDPAIEMDLPAWCRSTGHSIESESKQEGVYRYFVRKK
jgi:tRNA 2-thiouridine synthesizing protein A